MGKQVWGLKWFPQSIRRLLHCICTGRFKTKTAYFKEFWMDKYSSDGANDSAALEERNVRNIKARYERKRLESLEHEHERDINVLGEQRFYDSGIRDIELGVLEWFKEKWLEEETSEKVKFYLWLKADYMEHFQQYVYNKYAHFQKMDTQNKYEAISVSGKKIVAIVSYIVTFLLGANVKDLWDYIRQNYWLEGQYKWLTIGIILLAAVFVAVFLIWGFMVLFHTELSQKDNTLRQREETWVRHVAAIGSYQREMLAYIWNLETYQNCADQKEKDQLLMEKILDAWIKDNEKFQLNMSKSDD